MTDSPEEQTTHERARSLLDELNRLLGDDAMTPVEVRVDLGRPVVQEVIEMLRDHAELEGVLVDTDIRNVIRFVEASRSFFMEDHTKKVGKKVVSAKKEKLVAKRVAAVSADLGDDLLGAMDDLLDSAMGATPKKKVNQATPGESKAEKLANFAAGVTAPKETVKPVQKLKIPTASPTSVASAKLAAKLKALQNAGK